MPTWINVTVSDGCLEVWGVTTAQVATETVEGVKKVDNYHNYLRRILASWDL